MKKRLVSMLIAIAMICTMAIIPAMAASNEPTPYYLTCLYCTGRVTTTRTQTGSRELIEEFAKCELDPHYNCPTYNVQYEVKTLCLSCKYVYTVDLEWVVEQFHWHD